MDNEQTIIAIVKTDKINREEVENRLRKLCNESTRLNFDNLIERLHEITEYKIPIHNYKMTSFIEWLIEDLEFAKDLNKKYYDMPKNEIEKILNDPSRNQYWIEEFEKFKHLPESDFPYNSWGEYMDDIDSYIYGNSIDNIFKDLQKEYEHRNRKGLI